MYFDNILGPIKQWGYLVKDLDRAMQCWVEQLGVGPWWGFKNVPMESTFEGEVNQITIDVALGYQNGVQIELIQQTNATLSPYSAFYATEKEQFLHQIAYHAPEIDKAVAACRARGMREVGNIRTYMDTSFKSIPTIVLFCLYCAAC